MLSSVDGAHPTDDGMNESQVGNGDRDQFFVVRTAIAVSIYLVDGIDYVELREESVNPVHPTVDSVNLVQLSFEGVNLR